MEIATGASESHPTPLPYDPGLSPGVGAPTEVVPGQLVGPTVAAADTVGQQQERLAGMEADLRAAQASGMTAEHDRRAHYAGANTDPVVLPVVPDASTPVADQYKPLDEPMPYGNYQP